MNRQTVLMLEQSEAVKRQEGIALEQSAIAKRQGEIVDTQHRIMQEQLARRAILSATLITRTIEIGRVTYEFIIRNSGNQKCTGLYWQLYIPRQGRARIRVEPQDPLIDPRRVLVGNIDCNYFKAWMERPILKGGYALAATITVEYDEDYGSIACHWHLESDDGDYPGPEETGSFDLGKMDQYLEEG